MIEVILEIHKQVPAVVLDFTQKRRKQFAANEDVLELVDWRTTCWNLIDNREPETNQDVAFLRAVLCLLFPIDDTSESAAVLLDDFIMFMEMAGDFESVFMSCRHLLLGQTTN